MTMLQRLRERFWFIPAVLGVGAFVLAEALIALDAAIGDLVVPGWVSVLVYRVGESGSRDILGAIASSSLAVAGTTFSITMAVLALTSSAYGPRLVRNFMADRGNQTVLGILVSTFLYSLLVLRSIRVIGDPGNQDAQVFVPHLAVNTAVLLAVVDVVALIYFIHHISESIQVSTLAGRVRAELLETIDRLFPAELGREPGAQDGAEGGAEDRAGGGAEPALPGSLEETGVPVTAVRGGYLQSIREDDLMSLARRHDVLLALRVRPGQYVLTDQVVALIHPPERADDRLLREVRSAFQVAETRSPHQDPEFAIQQLTEMAVRALSPGTNDPYTAVNALNDLSAGLVRLVGRRPPSPARLDRDGVVRVHAPTAGVAELVGSVIDAMRWYAVSAPSVMHATLALVERLGEHARTAELRAELDTHVHLLEQAFAGAGHQQRDVAGFADHAAAVRRSLRRVGSR